MSDATFFEQMKRSFVDVSITPDTKYINTTEFLEASESLVKLFDLLGSTAFSVVQKDMSGNIEKIRARLLANPDKSETLQDLVLNEKSIDKKRTATQGLLWLNRYVICYYSILFIIGLCYTNFFLEVFTSLQQHLEKMSIQLKN